MTDYLTFEDYLAEQLEDPEFRALWLRSQPAYDLALALLKWGHTRHRILHRIASLVSKWVLDHPFVGQRGMVADDVE